MPKFKSSKATFSQCLKITLNIAFDFLNFGIFYQVCPIKSNLSGNTVWLQTSDSIARHLTVFGIFNKLLSSQIVNVARFARNVEWDFLSNFQTMWFLIADLWLPPRMTKRPFVKPLIILSTNVLSFWAGATLKIMSGQLKSNNVIYLVQHWQKCKSTVQTIKIHYIYPKTSL